MKNFADNIDLKEPAESSLRGIVHSALPFFEHPSVAKIGSIIFPRIKSLLWYKSTKYSENRRRENFCIMLSNAFFALAKL